MTALKHPDTKLRQFTANGVEYFIEQSLSFDRYKMYQKLQIECGYDVSFYGLFEQLKKLYELLNAGKLADAAVMSHNMMSGITNIDKRELPVLEMCALFVNTLNEDRKEITQDMVDKKVSDWRKEGIAIDYFFTLAISSIQNYMKSFNEVSQLTSHRTNLKKQKSSTLSTESTS